MLRVSARVWLRGGGCIFDFLLESIPADADGNRLFSVWIFSSFSMIFFISGMAFSLIFLRFLMMPACCHMRCLICCFRARAVFENVSPVRDLF